MDGHKQQNNRRILIIDDQESIHRDFEKSLRSPVADSGEVDDLAALVLGDDEVKDKPKGPEFELTFAFQGRDALETLKKARAEGRPFALAFVDMRMPPGWDGLETIENLWKEDAALLCVICTAYSDHSWDDITSRLGDTDRLLILKKPFDAVEVKQLAGALTTRWNLAREARIKHDELESMVQRRTETIEKQNQELALHQEYMIRDQEIAKTVFSGLVNRGDRFLSDSMYLHIPAETFNGDIVLVARSPSRDLHIMVGDFTGHGLSSAIGASPASEIFYGMTRKGYAIDQILPEINRRLRELLPPGLFLAACVVQLDVENKSLSIWNGGLPEILLHNRESGKIRARFASSHLPLGVASVREFETNLVRMSALEGDRLILCTDGIEETESPEGEMFGRERLESLVEGSSDASHLVQSVQDALQQFRGDTPQNDDVTMAEFSCTDLSEIESHEHEGPLAVKMAIPTTWSLQHSFQLDALRERDPLPLIIESIIDVQELHEHRTQLFGILSDLLRHTVDYCLLDLDSVVESSDLDPQDYHQQRAQRLHEVERGSVRIDVDHAPLTDGGGRLQIRITCDCQTFVTGSPLLDRVRESCSSLEVDQGDRQFEVSYEWREPAPT